MDPQQQLRFSHGRTFDLGEDMERLANKLIAIHGPGRIARERSGVHLYLPSPICLELYGEEEIYKKHLTVNLTKACDGGKWVATCHKESKNYSIEDLLYMPRLEERGFTSVSRSMTSISAKEEDLQEDDHGVLVPKLEMHTTPLRDLPLDHPAMLYLRQRDMADPTTLSFLTTCLEAAFCTAYWGKKYANIYPGLANSPAGRLILFCRQMGSIQGFQGRVIEYVSPEDGSVFLLHPDCMRWMRYKDGRGELLTAKANLAKYLTAYGTVRQRTLYGYDAACAFVEQTGRRYCVLVEGPLDIARIGPPGVALTGKYISADQVRLLVSRFDEFVVATDDDDSGNTLAHDAIQRIRSYGKKAERMVPHGGANKPGGKADIGNMVREEALYEIQQTLNSM